MAVFWFVAPLSVVYVYQFSEDLIACIIRAMMMEAVQTSETSVNSYQSTWRHNPEDGRLYPDRRENLKSYFPVTLF
jgi:hypothetical protein